MWCLRSMQCIWGPLAVAERHHPHWSLTPNPPALSPPLPQGASWCTVHCYCLSQSLCMWWPSRSRLWCWRSFWWSRWPYAPGTGSWWWPSSLAWAATWPHSPSSTSTLVRTLHFDILTLLGGDTLIMCPHGNYNLHRSISVFLFSGIHPDEGDPCCKQK